MTAETVADRFALARSQLSPTTALLALALVAAIGFTLGVLFTVFVVYVYVVVPDRPYSLALWATLGFVLAVGTGLLLTTVLTLRSAVQRARELE